MSPVFEIRDAFNWNIHFFVWKTWNVKNVGAGLPKHVRRKQLIPLRYLPRCPSICCSPPFCTNARINYQFFNLTSEFSLGRHWYKRRFVFSPQEQICQLALVFTTLENSFNLTKTFRRELDSNVTSRWRVNRRGVFPAKRIFPPNFCLSERTEDLYFAWNAIMD